ncbi:MAG: YbaB/EbfC family nucleoid-associated protein [Candidatus Kerfeldbacteria bacterium]|nr:YbaB/EbfC family nucleoid-associated protein [Candidatus Kerfeldbacteria bacterium]
MSMFSKLKEIKNLRSQAKTIQGLLADVSVEGSAAWGKVKLKMSGNQEVQSVDIDPELLTPAKKSDLEKALAEAMTEANKKAQKAMAEKVRASGVSLPGLK